MKRPKFRFSDARRRYHIFYLLTLVLILVVVGRLFLLQVLQGAKWARITEDQMTNSIRRNTPRGRIVDRNGEELAVSIMVHSLYVNPKEMNETPAALKGKKEVRDTAKVAAEKLAPVLKMKQDELYSDFKLKGQFLWIKRMLEPPEYEAVKQVIKENDLPGLHFIEESKRYYTKKSMAAQVLGFVGTDDSGLSGLELALDSVLKGAETRQVKRVDAMGRTLAGGEGDPSDTKEKPMVATVYLTIDSKMQFVIEDALDDAMKRTHAQGAAIIIMDPHTGAVLAMGSRPPSTRTTSANSRRRTG